MAQFVIVFNSIYDVNSGDFENFEDPRVHMAKNKSQEREKSTNEFKLVNTTFSNYYAVINTLISGFRVRACGPLATLELKNTLSRICVYEKNLKVNMYKMFTLVRKKLHTTLFFGNKNSYLAEVTQKRPPQ